VVLAAPLLGEFGDDPHRYATAKGGKSHTAALRQLGNRQVGILHGCLKTGTRYDEHTAWGHQPPVPEPAAA
jgi:hypothetical protein